MNYTAEQEALCDTPLNQITWTVFDLETTGIDAENNAIIEIAAVRIGSDFTIDQKNTFGTLINPGCAIPQSSTDIHNITNEAVKNAPDFLSAYYNFTDFARDTVLVAHNAAKDMAFLRVSLSEYFTTPLFPFIIDSLRLARLLYKGIKHDLESLSQIFHFDKRVRGPLHRALPDAERTALLFRKIMKEIFPKECHLLGELLQIQSMHK